MSSHFCRNKLVLVGSINTIEARPDNLWRCASDMYFSSSRVSKQLNNLLGSSTANNRIVYHYDALTCNNVRKRVELQAYTQLTKLLCRLNERSCNVAVFD